MSYSKKYAFASLPRTQRGTPIVLGGDPKGKHFLYTNGNSVYIRDINNPEICDIYTQHSTTVTVAKYSPSGFYIASGDASGKVRIWDTVNLEHILKNEFQPISGEIRDIAWSPDSQRIVVVGNGREKYAHVFMADTGTSVGEILGQTKIINTVDYRPARPFRIITGSEDNSVGFFEGPPFKFKLTKHDHTRFVQAVRFSPSGELFATGGFDGKIFIYDGKTAELVGEMGSPAHKGGVYAVAWSPDGKQLLSSSGDKTCKIWDVETRTMVTDFCMGTTVEDQQYSCLWQGEHLLTVGLHGFITYLDPKNPSQPIRVIKGHNKPITALAVSQDKSHIYTGSHDGNVTQWDAASGANERVQGVGHGNYISGAVTNADSIVTIGYDDALRTVNELKLAYTDCLTLGAQPRAISAGDDTVAVITVKEIVLLKGNSRVASLPISYDPSALAFNAASGELAVGTQDTNQVIVYQVSGASISQKLELQHRGAVTDAAYSPDGQFLVACDGHRQVVLYRLPDYQVANPMEWAFHAAKVNCVAWSPDSSLVASGSLDTNVIVWSARDPRQHLIMKRAHDQSQVTRVGWLDNETLVSAGQDCNTRLWNISL
ncbi:actin-interacting protein 1-like [Pollicipes pollicipes]|uniref:actin-interacting protein 1-like n=1 Tax=Pollicipes pollicipes TaxID=41117 RepID=UPI0018858C85|nr:actin-interacting protein 1-like [Pollicipes pollicipes]